MGASMRFRLLGWAFVLLVLAVPCYLLFSVQLGFGVLAATWVFIPPLLFAGIATRGITQAHRYWAGRVLGEQIPRPYRPRTKTSLYGRALEFARDPATWRDWLWLFTEMTVGVTLVLLEIGLFAGAMFEFVYPLLWYIVPDVFDRLLGFIPVNTLPKAFLSYPFGLLVLAAWWLLVPRLARAHALLTRSLLAPTERARLAGRVQQLAESRVETVDAQAAELRRIERDLHDGAQARLVALGMNLGMAEEILARDPEAARELLVEARESTGRALSELRDLVRGIHPPVLADRGLEGAVRALALAIPLSTEVTAELPGRFPPPVESATYFAVAESLTNAVKHAAATVAWVRIGYADGVLSIVVGDNGRGGASLGGGTGLQGIRRRLAAFDGVLEVSSPAGGPTVVSMEVPCELSSQKISPSSGTG